jgi:rubrerythrin
MTLRTSLSSGWRRFRFVLWPDHRQQLIEVLCDEYLAEANDFEQFQEHALRMTYPSFRERLLRIARIHEEEKRHRAEILEMLMKSDPQAALVGNVL